MPKTLDLTRDLMSRASVSPTDGGCQALLCERLQALGFAIEHLRFGIVDNFWRGAAPRAPYSVSPDIPMWCRRARSRSGAAIRSSRTNARDIFMAAALRT